MNTQPEQNKSLVSVVQKSHLPTVTIQSHVSIALTSQSPTITVQSQIPVDTRVRQCSQFPSNENFAPESESLAYFDFDVPNITRKNTGNESAVELNKDHSSQENATSNRIVLKNLTGIATNEEEKLVTESQFKSKANICIHL